MLVDPRSDYNMNCRRHLQIASLLLLLFSVQLIESTMFEGDACEMKNSVGTCLRISRCKTIENWLKAGALTTKEVVHCGFVLVEEIICCPSTPVEDRYDNPNGTTQTSRDFWLDLLTTSSTMNPTTQPDFWLHLLTTSTTPRPLFLGANELSANSGYYDFSKLLAQQSEPTSNIQVERDADSGPIGSLASSSGVGFVPPNTFPMKTERLQLNNWNPPSRGLHKGQNNGNHGGGNSNTFNMGLGQHGISMSNGRWKGASFQLQTQIEPQPQAHFGQAPSNNGRWAWNSANAGKVNVQPTSWIGGPFNAAFFPNSQTSPQQLSEFTSATTRPNRPIFPSHFNNRPHTMNVMGGNPIAFVNQNLLNSGLAMEQAFEYKPSSTVVDQSFKPNSSISDPYTLFQIRPQITKFGGAGIVPTARQPASNEQNNSLVVDPSSTKRPSSSTSHSMPAERPAVRACREIDAKLTPLLTPQILGGTPAQIGEYPHMAAIGFTSSLAQNDEGSYTFNCGGTLIDKRYVLTAAHCLNKRELRPKIVRMGAVNFSDPIEVRDAVEIPIARSHIHPNYGGGSVYHDIAVVELLYDVPYSDVVYPTCLYTDLEDPPSSSRLEVTGWGTIDTDTRQVSNVLLHARLNIVSLDQCNATYAEQGFTRHIRNGLMESQLCAYDPGLTRDACQGDSGGPLNLVVDESLKKYRIVGIISTGFSCGGRIPGLYTRVASYIDYIESIVWPSQ